MSIHTDIVTALEGVVDDRVFVEAAPQDIVLPMVIFLRRNRDPLQTLLGSTGDVNSEFVFECYAKTKLEALDVADDVRAAIVAAKDTVLPVQYELPVSSEDYEPEVMEYMEPVSFGFWHS